MDQLDTTLGDAGALLRSLFASSGDCIKILDLDGNLLFMTEGGQRLMEVADFGKIQGCPWPSFWQGKGNTEATAAVAAARAGHAAQFQAFATTMAGTPKWWDVQVSPIFGKDHKPEKILSVSRDITATRLAAQSREAAERQLILALHAGRLGHWSFELANGKLIASDFCKENFGRDPSAEFTYDELRNSTHPDDRERMEAAIQRTIDSNEDYDIEYRIVKPDGSPGWVMMRGQLTRDEFGKPAGLSGVSLDITSLKQAQSALVESETRFKTFAQVMPNQVWSATPDGLLDWFNDKVLDYSGIAFETLKGVGWAQMVHADDIGTASASWAKSLSDGSAYQIQFRLRRADGAWRWHLARALPIKDEAGAITRWVGTNTDIDDQKALEVRQTLLAGELEHRIKNTLAMVSAIASQTFRTAVTKEEARDTFDARLAALNKAHQILTSTSWTGAPIGLVVEGALASHRSGEGRIRIGGPEVQLSAQKSLSLALALHELATNATKYGALSVPQGTIDVAWNYSYSSGSPSLHFEWRESGGPVVTKPTHRGFGTRLIERTLTSDFGSETAMHFEPTGLVCTFDVKLSQLEPG